MKECCGRLGLHIARDGRDELCGVEVLPRSLRSAARARDARAQVTPVVEPIALVWKQHCSGDAFVQGGKCSAVSSSQA